MYTLTSSGTDSHSAHVVIITCQTCCYFVGHFRDRRLEKVGKPWGRYQDQDRRS